MTKIFEAKTKVKNMTLYGYSYERALFALNDLINKSIDKGVKMTAKHQIQVIEAVEDSKTNMISFTPFPDALNIKGKYNDLHDYLSNNNL